MLLLFFGNAVERCKFQEWPGFPRVEAKQFSSQSAGPAMDKKTLGIANEFIGVLLLRQLIDD